MIITIIGAGALGSHLMLLARNWDCELNIIDFDKVESKNTQSQFHTRMGLGKNKAKALQSVMQGLFKKSIVAFPVKLDKNNHHLLAESKLIVDCTDNYAARTIIQSICEKYHTDCLHGCLSADGNFARAMWSEDFTPDKEDEIGQATCEDGDNLPFHAQAAALLAQVVQKYINTGIKENYQLTPFSIMRL